jgi:multiple sugar transport system substrate-binding protein
MIGSGRSFVGRQYSRRRFLQMGGAGLLAGAGLLGATGCGGGSSGEVTLRYGIWDQTQMPAMEQIVKAFSKAHPDISVEIELTPYDEYLSKLQNAAQGGTLPDVFWMEPLWFPSFASNEIISPITDQIKDAGIDLGLYPEDVVRFYEYEGDNYALPKDYDTIGLWYNEKLFDDAGVPYPDGNWDWQDFTDAAVELTDQSRGIWGTAAPLDSQQGHWNTIYQQDGCIVCDEGGELRSGYDTEEAISGVKFWTDLILKYKASPTQAAMTETEPYQSFFSGKLAMIYLGSWNAVLLKDYKEIAESINVVPLPEGRRRSTCTNGLGNVISASTDYPEEAWALAKFLAERRR